MSNSTLPPNVHDFAVRLREANEILDNHKDEENYRLAAMIHAINSVITFVNSLDIPGERLVAPFVQLQLNLLSVVKGMPPADFRIKLKTRSKDDARLSAFKMECAVAMQHHMNTGKSVREASEAVSRGLKGHDIKPGTIEDWRDNHLGHSSELFAGAFHMNVEVASRHGPLTEAKIAAGIKRIAEKYQGIDTKKRKHSGG